MIKNNTLRLFYRNCIILTAALSSVPALAKPPASELSAAALMSIEQQWLTALNRHDVAMLARILGREFVDSDAQGDAITRAQYLAYFAHPVTQPSPPVRQRFEDTKVRFVAGGGVAIVTGVVVSQVRHSRFTDVFVWRDARWQAVTGQETHFTPGQKIQ
jgi:hypothetical protein